MDHDETLDDQQQRQRLAVRDLMVATPYIAWTAMAFERWEPDEVTLRLPFDEKLTNDGTHYHGGVIAAALDTAGAGAAWSGHDFAKGSRASTVSMSVQYIGAARRSDLICAARAVKRGRELIFCEIGAVDTENRPIAHALQTYRIV